MYSASGNRIAAAYVTDADAVVEHKLYWMPVAGVSEGHYLAAILNSDVVMDRVIKLQSRGLFGARDIDTLPWRLPIPIFDPDNELHRSIADLGESAASLAETADLSTVAEFTAGRALVRASLASAGVAAQINGAVAELIGSGLVVVADDAPADIEVISIAEAVEAI
ncbi:hypothetical protein [Salinibacterium sp. ZJ450]|uniref:hypothetical protein n=1 Tax=Salinibacterium sp. ZJ450 TaxID=2708338 RepID=UPI00141F827B|nr:hypothetical protein [Salinibacterium sp. ZJ450]